MDNLTSASRAELAQETRLAAARLDQLTTIEVMCNGVVDKMQDASDHRMVWTLIFLADVLDGKPRN